MRHRIFPSLLSLSLALGLCVLPAAALETDDLKTLLQTYYVDQVPENVLDQDTVQAVLDALNDPYTTYMTAEEYQSFLNQVDGETVVGIGVSIQTTVNDGVQILSVLEGSPAQEAGLSAGDRILSVDGVTLEPGMDPSSLIRGEAGSRTTLTVRLHSTGKTRDFTLERRAVVIPIVTYELKDGDVGYIKCDSFGASTAATVQEEVGTRGAKTAGVAMRPDCVIVLEGPPADDTPGFTVADSQGALGGGVQIRLFDPTAITNPRLAALAEKTAADAGIPFQLTVRRSGGTDAAALHLSGRGVPTIVLGIPTRYIHAHNGVLDLRDYRAAVELTVALVRALDREAVEALTHYLP